MAKLVYSADDHNFVIKEWLDTQKILDFKAFEDTYDLEDIEVVLDEALKVAKEVVSPTNSEGDKLGISLENGRSIMPECYHKLYDFMQENDYGNSQFDPNEEGKLPHSVQNAVEEFMTAANPAFHSYPNLGGNAARLISRFGTEDLKERFTRKMYSGQWSGTMCLTEPSCGSDVGYITTKAIPTDEPGIYEIKGEKIFITAGDHDLTENIIHLLLARVEGAAPGTKGISLFVVPKVWVNEDGSIGDNNGVATVGLEHKMGLRGSATAALSFGDGVKCRGFLLGNPPDENGYGEGMKQMFVMMNSARHATGLASEAIMQAVYNFAREYAKERVQGLPVTGESKDRVRLIEHEDIRRMLMDAKAMAEVCRAMVFFNAHNQDLAEYSDDEKEREAAGLMIDVCTPMVKGYPTDSVWNVTAEAIQVYGGYGFIEEYPVAQYARDCKIYSIWEGTTYIQSMDLIKRKWQMNGGKPFESFIQRLEDMVERAKKFDDFDEEVNILSKALSEYKDMRQEVLVDFRENISRAALFATRILYATSYVFGGALILDQAVTAKENLQSVLADGKKGRFYQSKIATAKYYVRNVVPNVFNIVEIVRNGDTTVIDIQEDLFV